MSRVVDPSTIDVEKEYVWRPGDKVLQTYHKAPIGTVISVHYSGYVKVEWYEGDEPHSVHHTQLRYADATKEKRRLRKLKK